MNTYTDIDVIKNLWQELKNDGTKTEFIESLAKKLSREPTTLRQHWFSNVGFWRVPKQYQKTVISELRKTIKKQDKNL